MLWKKINSNFHVCYQTMTLLLLFSTHFPMQYRHSPLQLPLQFSHSPVASPCTKTKKKKKKLDLLTSLCKGLLPDGDAAAVVCVLNDDMTWDDMSKAKRDPETILTLQKLLLPAFVSCPSLQQTRRHCSWLHTFSPPLRNTNKLHTIRDNLQVDVSFRQNHKPSSRLKLGCNLEKKHNHLNAITGISPQSQNISTQLYSIYLKRKENGGSKTIC